MGGVQGKGKKEMGSPEGPIVDLMRRKYGDQSLEFLPEWSKDFGFPANGSFSRIKLNMLRTGLEAKEKDIKSQRVIKGKDLENIEKQSKWLKWWEDECECRERKQMAKELTCAKTTLVEKPDPNVIEQNDRCASSPLYPSLTGAGGPLLNTCPPPYPASPANQQPPSAGAHIKVHYTRQREEKEAAVKAAQERLLGEEEEKRQAALLTRSRSPGATGGDTSAINKLIAEQPSTSDVFSPSFDPEGVPPDAKSVLQTPMIQVPGHSGPILVFRSWTDTDIRAAMAHLPPIQHSGRLFAEAFMDFCKQFLPNFAEIRRVLMSHVGPTHYQKLNQLVAGDTSAADVEWSSNQNKPYRDTLTALNDGIKTLFPDKVDMTPINNTKQAAGESVHDYYQRLLTVFNLNSGIPQPAALGDALGTWESHLKNAFMNGLLPDIKMTVQRSVAGMEDSRLADVKKHAAHAQSMDMERTDHEGKRRSRQIELAQLTMLQAVTQLARNDRPRDPNQRGGFRGRGRDMTRGRSSWNQEGSQLSPPNDYDTCFRCGEQGHWHRECPQNAPRRGWGRGLARRGRGGNAHSD
ncbi:uncharacterized protein LOC144391064 [Gasterosteus aculeatus]